MMNHLTSTMGQVLACTEIHAKTVKSCCIIKQDKVRQQSCAQGAGDFTLHSVKSPLHLKGTLDGGVTYSVYAKARQVASLHFT